MVLFLDGFDEEDQGPSSILYASCTQEVDSMSQFGSTLVSRIDSTSTYVLESVLVVSLDRFVSGLVD